MNSLKFKSICRYDPTARRLRLFTLTSPRGKRQVEIALEGRPFRWANDYTRFAANIFFLRVCYRKSTGGRYV